MYFEADFTTFAWIGCCLILCTQRQHKILRQSSESWVITLPDSLDWWVISDIHWDWCRKWCHEVHQVCLSKHQNWWGGGSKPFQTDKRCTVSQITEKGLNLDLETSPSCFWYLRAFLLVHGYWKHLEAQLAHVLKKFQGFFIKTSWHGTKASTSQRKSPKFGFVNI